MAREYDPEAMFGEAARKECLSVTDRIVEHIKGDGLTPVKTGELINGYHSVATEEGAEVRTRVYYWKFVEYGHRIVAWGHQTGKFEPPQPHVRPAVEATRGEATRR